MLILECRPDRLGCELANVLFSSPKSLPDIEAEHGRLGKTVNKTGPGLWALWNIGKAEAIWKSPGAEEIPSSLVPWSHQSGGLSPGSDCLVLGQSSWQSRQNGVYRALGRPSDVLGWSLVGWRVWGMTDP